MERAMLDSEAIQGMITRLKKKVELTPPDHPDLANRLRILGIILAARFDRTQDPSDIQDAISAARKLVDITPPGHADLASRLSRLGGLLQSRSECTGDPADIQEAISTQQRAIEITPTGHADLPDMLSQLGNFFYTQFERTGDIADMQGTISAAQRAIDLTPPGHPDLPGRLGNLGISLQIRFECTGLLADIQDAISAKQKAIELTPPGHPHLPRLLSNLGCSFQSRFECMGDIADIQEAISIQQKAIELTPPGDPNLPGMLSNLGVLFQTRFKCMGDLADIQEAISMKRKAIELTPVGHADLPGGLSNLANSYGNRFLRTRDLADIQEAISTAQRAVELTPVGHKHLPDRLNNLGGLFRNRFEDMGDLADIQEAISILQKAVEYSSPGHTSLPIFLSNLGVSFHTRFERSGDLADLQEAISAKQKAVELTPAGHAALSHRLDNLAVSFQTRFQHTSDDADIQEAITAARKAVELVPPGHESLPSRLSNLGNSLRTRFECTRDPTDIQEAVSVQQKAIGLTPLDHAELARRLNDLGYSQFVLLRAQFARTENCGDPIEALDCFRRAANASTGSPSVRLIAAQLWAYNCTPELDVQQTLAAFDKAIELLSLAAGLEQTLSNRHQNLAKVSNLPLEAAAAAFSVEMTEKALEWLEQGRCIVWAQLNNLRTPIRSLRARNQPLADRILEVSKSLELAGSRTVSQDFNTEGTRRTGSTQQDEAKQHVALAKEWGKLLKTTREIPGFETFLLPTPASALFGDLPVSGSTVVINLNKDRCDALALFSEPKHYIHIPLPHFSYSKASHLCKGLQKILADTGLRGPRKQDSELEADSEGELHEHENKGANNRAGRRSRDAITTLKVVLRDLWVDLVKPIIERLGYTSSRSSTEKPRIWWCATGPLTFLPLHAAGIYGRSDGPKVSDFAISSYTPSVSALVQRVKNPPMIDGEAQGIFMLSQPDVPGLPSIPATTSEIRIIEKQLVEHQVPYLTLEGEHANIDVGITNIESYGCVHLACHAAQDASDPLKSGFFLNDGTLQLSTIVKANLKNADLAFLSACQTSKGDEKLSEEAVHLAAGMLAAGYRGVIATMWSIRDDYAPKIADLFYKEMFAYEVRAGRKGLNGSHAAYALHQAIQEFQDSLPDTDSTLLAWIPYVHFGL